MIILSTADTVMETRDINLDTPRHLANTRDSLPTEKLGSISSVASITSVPKSVSADRQASVDPWRNKSCSEAPLFVNTIIDRKVKVFLKRIKEKYLYILYLCHDSEQVEKSAK